MRSQLTRIGNSRGIRIPKPLIAHALDQLRAVDRQRLVRKLGTVSNKTAVAVSSVLAEMFVR